MARKFYPRARRADSNNGKIHWQAKWIWCDGEPSPKNFYLLARRVFECKDAPESAVVHCTADSRYQLYVNGQFVGSGPVRSDPQYQTYDTYDVTSLLVKGKNSVALLVHHYGEATYSYVPGRGGLLCQLELEQTGEKTVIGTDENWKVLPMGPWNNQGAKMSERLGFQEVYDARLDLASWNMVKFNDNKWQKPVVLGNPPVSPWQNLIPRTIPHLRSEQILPKELIAAYAFPPSPDGLEPKDVPALMASEEFQPLKKGDVTGESEISNPDGHGIKLKGARSGGKGILIDFGREVSGRISLDLTGYTGGIVDIGYAEKLNNGRIDPGKSDVLYSDRVIMKSGRFDWTSFESRGFRYMQIDFRDIKRPVHLHSASVIETLYPTEPAGYFESSDEMLNRIWSVGAQTTKLCMEDTFVDSPWRERASWWADTRVQSHVAYYAFGDTALLGQGIRHIARTQQEDGAIMAFYPVAEDRVVPDFAMLWIMSVWEYYSFTGDRAALFELYPAVTRVLGWLNRFTDHDGLLANVEGWNFVDWGDIDHEGESTAINCFYYKALRRAEHMALVLNRGADADRWNGMAALLRIAINKHLWSSARGLYADSRVNGKIKDKFSRQANVLIVLFDVADHYRKSTVCRQLMNGGLPQISTPYFMGYFVDALFRTGFTEDALDLIRKRWGAMIEAGATTFWEHFEPTDSLCHGWSTSPTRDLSAYVLGIQPISGKRRVRIEVHTGDLKWAKGAVPTPYGLVEVDWRQNRRDFTMTVNIPQGMTADLELTFAKPGARISINGMVQDVNSFELFSGTFNVKIQQPTAGKESQAIMDRNARENVVEYLSGHQLWRTNERRPRRKVRGTVAEGEPEHEEEIITDEEIEYVEGIDEIPPIAAIKPEDLRREAVSGEAEAVSETRSTDQAGEDSSRRKSRRGRRGRRKGRPGERPAASPAEQVTEETTGEPVTETAAEAVSPAAVAAETQAVSEPEVPARAKKSRRRGRKTSKAAPETTEQPVEVTAPEEPIVTQPEPQVETGQQEAAPGAKPKPRRRRKKPETAETVETQQVTPITAPVEPVVEERPQKEESEAESTSTGAPKPFRRRRRARTAG